MLNLCFVYDLGAETHTSDVYYTSSVLYFIVISKMAVSFFFHENYDAIKNTEYIKLC